MTVQTQLRYQSQEQRYPGMLHRSNPVQHDQSRVIERILDNSGKQTIANVTVAGTIGTETFTLNFTGTFPTGGTKTVAIVVAAESGDTATVVAGNLVDAINDDDDLNDVLVASNVAGVISFDLRYENVNPIDSVSGSATGSATITAAPTVTDYSESGSIPFGYVVGQYEAQANDQCAKVTTTSGLTVLGIAIRDFAHEADYPYNRETVSAYKRGRVAICKREEIWVPVAAAVVRGTVPYFLNATGQITTNGAGSATALTGAIFETSANAGETALVSINLA